MRKRWIKFWTQETLYGTTSKELRLDEQACWFKLLALAGDSPEPGKVEVAPNIPMTDQQIAAIFRAPLSVWLRTKNRLLASDVSKILINEGVIHIVNWEKYQSDWNRIKHYPSQQPTTEPTSQLVVGDHTVNPTKITDKTRQEQSNINIKDNNLISGQSIDKVQRMLRGGPEARGVSKKKLEFYRSELKRRGIPILEEGTI